MNISPVNSVNNQNFAARVKPSMFSRANAAFNDTQKAISKGYDNFIENTIIKPVIAPIMNSKTMGKIADWSATKDNMAGHLSTAGAFVTTSVYANRTLNNDKLDKKRARTLALNQVLVTAVSTVCAYTVNSKLKNFSKNLGYKFREVNQGNPNLTKRMKGFDIAKQLLIFTAMNRYVAPVLVTPLASKLGKFMNSENNSKKS